MKIPILMYHEVTPDPLPAYRRYTVTPERFEAQLRLLTALGYRSVPLSEAALGITPPSPPVVAITFDDSYESALRYAVPLLQQYGMTATFFAIAGKLGEPIHWTRPAACSLRVASATALKELVAAGFRCGSHTMTHPHLPSLTEEACRAELRDSKAALEDLLGQPVSEFAYPFGAVNRRVARVAAECGYAAACTVEKRHAAPTDDPLRLPRVHVRGVDSRLDFLSGLVFGRSVGEQVLVTWRRCDCALRTRLLGLLPRTAA